MLNKQANVVSGDVKTTQEVLLQNPIVAGLTNLRSLSTLVGRDGTNNLIRAVIDLYLTSSNLTSRTVPINPTSLALGALLPDGQKRMLEQVYHWVDMAVASGVISEEELERMYNSDSIIKSITGRTIISDDKQS